MFKKKQKSNEVLDLARKQKVADMRKRAKEDLYPLLLESSKSVEDAKIFCQAMSIGIKTAFNQLMTKTTIADLKMIEKLDVNNPEYERYKKALSLFEDDKLTDALEVIEGMGGVIDSFIKEEMTQRKLDSLRATFL
jgi:hypothetical protein